MKATICAVVVMALLAMVPAAASADGSWLDDERPLLWNRPGMALPAVQAEDTEIFTSRRCSEGARPAESAEDQAVVDAGWFLMSGYAGGWGVRVVGGNGAFDGMCRPVGFQYFVFVDGVFAGTLSPEVMNSRFDGAAYAPWLLGPDRIYIEYVRYAPTDALCCPSGQTIVHFTIERTVSGPVVQPVSVFNQRVTPR